MSRSIILSPRCSLSPTIVDFVLSLPVSHLKQSRKLFFFSISLIKCSGMTRTDALKFEKTESLNYDNFSLVLSPS